MQHTTTMLRIIAALSMQAAARALDRYASNARVMNKPWYTRSIVVGNINLFITPVTLGILLVGLFYLLYSLRGSKRESSFCDASHILIMDHSSETEQKLVEYKKKINNDPALFAKHASKYSACPSKSQGGNLGKFKPHTMAPPFDKVCFDPESPLQTTLGPVHTTFGWHLIYIHNRNIVK